MAPLTSLQWQQSFLSKELVQPAKTHQFSDLCSQQRPRVSGHGTGTHSNETINLVQMRRAWIPRFTWPRSWIRSNTVARKVRRMLTVDAAQWQLSSWSAEESSSEQGVCSRESSFPSHSLSPLYRTGFTHSYVRGSQILSWLSSRSFCRYSAEDSFKVSHQSRLSGLEPISSRPPSLVPFSSSPHSQGS